MTLTEKAAYLKGLAEGLALDAAKPESKIINALIDIIDDLALTVSDLEDEVELMSEQLDAVDEDLDDLEEYVYEEDGDDMLDEEYFEVECPACGEVVCVDVETLEEGSLNCPNCNELLELEIDEDDCDCGCDECQK